ncbi:hypothetical protein CR513_31153, partial [Mucuna pruriens]
MILIKIESIQLISVQSSLTNPTLFDFLSHDDSKAGSTTSSNGPKQILTHDFSVKKSTSHIKIILSATRSFLCNKKPHPPPLMWPSVPMVEHTSAGNPR